MWQVESWSIIAEIASLAKIHEEIGAAERMMRVLYERENEETGKKPTIRTRTSTRFAFFRRYFHFFHKKRVKKIPEVCIDCAYLVPGMMQHVQKEVYERCAGMIVVLYL